MAEGLTVNLVWAAFICGLVGFFFAIRVISLPVALFVTFVKVSIPVIYFAWFFDGTWTFLDDMTYLSQGSKMLRSGYTPITALSDPAGILQLKRLSGGAHFLYGWWNLLGQYFFGKHYYSAVFMNMSLTFISGYFFVRILREIDFCENYRRWFMVFFLLHWDILAWSSFPNLKDIPVMTLTSVGLFLIVKLSRRIRIFTLIALVLVWFILTRIRYYIPFLILAAVGVWILLQWHDRRKYLLLPIICMIFYYTLPHHGLETGSLYFKPNRLLFGLFRFPLTPQPWNIAKSYSFLLLPSIIHWILFVPTLYAGWLLWNNDKFGRLLMIYTIVLIVFYALVEDLQGPRHRIQIITIIAWLQFHFLWTMHLRFKMGRTDVTLPIN